MRPLTTRPIVKLIVVVALAASVGLTVAACGTNETTAPKKSSLLLLGSWQYKAIQPVGFGFAFDGVVAIDSLADDNSFTGAFEGLVADSTGVQTQVTAVIAGRKTDTTSITFAFVTSAGDTITNTGTEFSDTLHGEWANRRAISVGSFTMVRESSEDDPGAPRVITRIPRRP